MYIPNEHNNEYNNNSFWKPLLQLPQQLQQVIQHHQNSLLLFKWPSLNQLSQYDCWNIIIEDNEEQEQLLYDKQNDILKNMYIFHIIYTTVRFIQGNINTKTTTTSHSLLKQLYTFIKSITLIAILLFTYCFPHLQRIIMIGLFALDISSTIEHVWMIIMIITTTTTTITTQVAATTPIAAGKTTLAIQTPALTTTSSPCPSPTVPKLISSPTTTTTEGTVKETIASTPSQTSSNTGKVKPKSISIHSPNSKNDRTDDDDDDDNDDSKQVPISNITTTSSSSSWQDYFHVGMKWLFFTVLVLPTFLITRFYIFIVLWHSTTHNDSQEWRNQLYEQQPQLQEVTNSITKWIQKQFTVSSTMTFEDQFLWVCHTTIILVVLISFIDLIRLVSRLHAI